MTYPIARIINLVPADSQPPTAEAKHRLLAADASVALEIDGSFALVAQDGERVLLARSLDRPLRYFLAKAVDGPVLIVAERIDEIAAELARRGWSAQFHPSYTRMVPAHHVTTLRLVGCPDPNPVHRRFFDPPRGTLPADLDVIGRHYIEAVYEELRRWLAVQEPGAPIGVPFSGGIDSGAVLPLPLPSCCSTGPVAGAAQGVHARRSTARATTRARRASSCRRTGLEMLGETIDVPSSAARLRCEPWR